MKALAVTTRPAVVVRIVGVPVGSPQRFGLDLTAVVTAGPVPVVAELGDGAQGAPGDQGPTDRRGGPGGARPASGRRCRGATGPGPGPGRNGGSPDRPGGPAGSRPG